MKSQTSLKKKSPENSDFQIAQSCENSLSLLAKKVNQFSYFYLNNPPNRPLKKPASNQNISLKFLPQIKSPVSKHQRNLTLPGFEDQEIESTPKPNISSPIKSFSNKSQQNNSKFHKFIAYPNSDEIEHKPGKKTQQKKSPSN